MKLKRTIIITVSSAAILGAAALGIQVLIKFDPPENYTDLAALSSLELKKVDIALMNLLCAEGLPGSEGINIKKYLEVFDQWAEFVKANEQKYSVRFLQAREQYDNSYAKFQAVNLGLTLKDDLKCGYNQKLVRSGAMEDIRSTRFFKDSKDIFIHGFIDSRSGSCSSLPVLMVAVGRRCGYPLHLVATKGHLFCRWDDGRERFNIETACPGVDSKPDSYYRQWPYPSTDSEIAAEGYLANLTPKQELGIFTQLRASCLEENKRFDEASAAYSVSLSSFPQSKYLKSYRNNINRRNRQ